MKKTFITSIPIGSTYGVTSTNDGGFAYVTTIGSAFKINQNTYRIANNNERLNWIKEFEHMPANKWTERHPWTRDVLLYKCNISGKIEWVKSFDGNALAQQIKQTKDLGFICYRRDRITKLDSLGNFKWNIIFSRDSIPNIKKSRFLTESGASDIYECKDSCFIALLGASFSLLKISKEGKPLWLKSTLFDTFDPMTFEIWNNSQSWKNVISGKLDSISLNNFQYKDGGGVYVPTWSICETDDGGYLSIGRNEYRNKVFISNYTDSVNIQTKVNW